MKPATASSFARGEAPLAIGLLDRRQEQRPALAEELVQHLVLRLEVVVDEPVGDARLVGDVGDPGRVEALAGEDADRRVEDLAALVDGGAEALEAIRRAPSSAAARRTRRGRRLASEGRDSRTRSWAARSRSAATMHSPSGAVARTTPQGSTIAERP